MSDDTQVLYPGESTGSEDLKIVRVARHVRGLRIATPQAHVAVVGLLSHAILMQPTEEIERDRWAIKDTLWRARNKLMQCGLSEDAIRVYVPYQTVPVQRPGQTVLYALNWAPRQAAPYMWDHQPKVQPQMSPSIEASFNMVYDVKGREEDEKRKERAERIIDCQVEVWIIRPGRSVKERLSTPGLKVALSVGPNGIEEFGAELTALKVHLNSLRLGEKVKSGTIDKVEIALKGEGTFSFENSTARRLIKEWQSKVMVSLAAEINIPVIKLKLPIEIKAYLDNEGKPGLGIQVQILQFD